MSFSSTKLSNGLTVLSYEMKNINSVAINVIANVGSRYELEDEFGMSHFLEHMAFKGTNSRSAKQIAEEFDSIGGNFNAYTSHEQTVYYAKILPENCFKALDILADIIQNSLFDMDEIKREHQVILQEIAHTQDNPDELIQENFSHTAFKDQAIGRPILGTDKTISKFTTKSFNDYVSKHYNAENLYLSVAGNIEHKLLVKYAEDLFSSLGRKDNSKFEPSKYIGGHSTITKELEQTTLLLGFESFPYLDTKKYYHSQMLSMLLGSGMSSRLFQQIRENLALAYSVGTYNNSYYDTGIFGIYASTSHDKLETLAKELCNEIRKISYDINDKELSRAKMQLKTSIYMAQEKSSFKSEEIGKNYAIFGRYIPTSEIIDIIMGITKEELLIIATNIFTSKATLSIIGPTPLSVNYSKLCEDLNR